MNEAQEKGITASLASDGCGFHLSRLIPMHTQFVDAPADVSRAVVTGLNALLDAKRPAEQREAEQIPHPVAEAEQSPQPAGDVDRLVKALQEIVTVADRYKVEPYHLCGYGCTQEDEERVAEEFAEIARAALAQAPTMTAGKGE